MRVWTYAQCLFYVAYSLAQQASADTESMGRSALVSQFVAGLNPELKATLAGKNGGFEKLLTLVRSEVAKDRDLLALNNHNTMQGPSKKSENTTS